MMTRLVRWSERAAFAFALAVALTGAVAGCTSATDEYGPPEASDLARMLSPDEVRRDVDHLVQTIEAVHIDPYRRISEAEFQRAVAAVTDDLGEPISRRALYRRLAPVVSRLEDGHTRLRLPVEEITAAVRRDLLWFPFDLALADSQATIIADYSTDSSITPGARLIAINGTPVAEIVRTLRGFVSSERPAHRLAALETYLPFYLWLAYEWEGAYDVTAMPPGAVTPVVAHVPGRTYREMQRQRDAVNGEGFFTFSFDPDAKTGVLEVRQFADRDGFRMFLQATFADVEAHGLDRLVIDLRQNGGGSTDVGAELLGYIADEPFRHFARYDLKVSRQVKRQFKGQIPGVIRWLPIQYLFARGRAIWGAPEGTTIAIDGEFVEPHEPERRFHGEVLVLVGPETFSTASDFASVVQDFEFATLIGEETGGLMCGFGDTHLFRLPQSRLEVSVSFKEFVRPSESCGERGVVPDHTVRVSAADRAAGRDPVVDYALTMGR
jgi:hypothetical protein